MTDRGRIQRARTGAMSRLGARGRTWHHNRIQRMRAGASRVIELTVASQRNLLWAGALAPRTRRRGRAV